MRHDLAIQRRSLHDALHDPRDEVSAVELGKAHVAICDGLLVQESILVLVLARAFEAVCLSAEEGLPYLVVQQLQHVDDLGLALPSAAR